MYIRIARHCRKIIRAIINSLGYDIIFLGKHDIELFKFYSNQVFQDMADEELVLFDVGSNRGDFSLEFLKQFPNSSSTLFEPIPSMIKASKKTLKNKNVTIIQAALSATEQTKKFSVYNNEDVSSFHEIDDQNDHARKNYIKKVGELSVKCIALDDYIFENSVKRIDLLKIDVQGGELEVLKGATYALKTVVKAIQVEISFNGFYKMSNHFGEIISTLDDNDYELLKIIDVSHFKNGQIMQADLIFRKKPVENQN